MNNIDKFKQYLRQELLLDREMLGITQDKMAERLHITTRAYSKLESGINCCSAKTFACVLLHCCPDIDQFISELSAVINHI